MQYQSANYRNFQTQSSKSLLLRVIMKYWLVCQNKTYEHEVNGGYLWSPKKKRR